jgi:hypothetical protein
MIAYFSGEPGVGGEAAEEQPGAGSEARGISGGADIAARGSTACAPG